MKLFFIVNLFTFKLLFCFNFFLFFLGLYGFLFRSTHYIYLIVCNEIMLFSIVLQFLLVGFLYDSVAAQVFVLFILLLASAEVVVVFSILLRYYKLTGVVYTKPVYFVQTKK